MILKIFNTTRYGKNGLNIGTIKQMHKKIKL